MFNSTSYYHLDKYTAILIAFILIFAYWIYNNFILPAWYFQKKGIPYITPWRDYYNVLRLTFFNRVIYSDITKEYYNSYPNARYVGIYRFGAPALILRDLGLIKKLGVTDFNNFMNHEHPGDDEVFSKSLFFMQNRVWRTMRTALNPMFNSLIFTKHIDYIDECSRNAVAYVERKNKPVLEMNMWDFASRFSNDIITYICFSIKINTLEDNNNDIYRFGKKTCDGARLLKIKLIIIALFPFLLKISKIPHLPKEVTTFFLRLVRDTIRERGVTKTNQSDIMHLLIQAQKRGIEPNATESNGKPQKMFTDEDLTAQILLLFMGGFDAISTAISFMALAIANHDDVQRKLQMEIDEHLEDPNAALTYDLVKKMKYMDQVVSETLRMWASGVQSHRICLNDYVIEPEKPNEKPYAIRKGEVIIIPSAAIMYDPKYFPNPKAFNPDRFSDENKHSIVAGTHIPFGVGPRGCIANRLARFEIKVFFMRILSKFDIVVTDKISRLPVKLEKDCFIEKPIGGFCLGLKKRVR